MKNKKLRRLLAGASTAVIAVGFAATFGAPVASAASVNKSTDSGSWTFNRTISNGTPAPGETVTVTNAIRWNGGLAPTISAFKDIHPTCLTYVAGSSRVTGSTVTTVATDPTFVSMTGSWIRSAVNRNIDYTLNYTVGANCARDIALITGSGISANQSTSSEAASAGPSLTVAKAATQTTLAVSQAPQSGRASTLTATVTNNAAGTVEFRNNGTLLGTGTAANGVATYAWTPTGADAGQAFSLTAKYLGDATNATSTSPAQAGTVAAAPTAPAAPTNLAVNPVTVVVGGTVTVSGKAEAGSSVTVTAGDKTCTATATAAGVFSCDIVTSAAGTLTVTAVAANAVGTGAASAPVTVTVSAPPDVDTTLGLTVPATATTGTSVNLTATVTPASAAGTVSFKVAGSEIGTAAISNGVATLAHTFASAGAEVVTADFLPAAGFVGSSASAQTVTVSNLAPVDVETSLVLVVPAAGTTDVAVDLTATVTPANAVGSVQFRDGGSNIGGPVAVSGGTATLGHAFNVSGAHSVTAVFVPAAGFVGSSASAQTVTVTDPAPVDVETSLVLGVPAAATTGSSVNLTATVTPSNAVGTVDFKVGGVSVGTAPVTAGVATLPHTFNAAGAPAVTASFSGTGFVASTAGPSTVTVSNPAPLDVATTLALAVPAAATTDVAVDLTATVTPANAVGSVQFREGGSNIGGPVAVSGGTATLGHAFNVSGAHSVTAVFVPAAGFVGSSASAQTVTVTDPAPVDVETSLVLGVPAAATTGSSVNLTATVTPSNAVGTVDFKVGGVSVGTAPVTAGVATLPHTFNAAGAPAVTASFSGTGFVASTAGPSTVTVSNPAPLDVATTLALAVPAAATTDVAVDLTATVTPANAVGSVQFRDGGSNIVGPVAVSGGTATLSHAFNVSGAHSVTAVFVPAAGFVGSSASAQTVTVSDAVVVDTTSTTVLSVAGEAKVGVALDLSAAVAGQPSGDPAPSGGTVDFKVNGNSVGSAPVVNGAATLSYTFTAPGSATVTAVYSGAGTLAGSTSNEASVNVTVETPIDADSTTTLTVPASGVVGTAVQLKANVSPLGSVGTVQFFEGTVPLGAAVNVVDGVAVLDHVFTATGSHTVTAVFSGGLGVATSISTPSTVDITAGDDGTGGTGSLGSLGNIFGS